MLLIILINWLMFPVAKCIMLMCWRTTINYFGITISLDILVDVWKYCTGPECDLPSDPQHLMPASTSVLVKCRNSARQL